MTEIAARLARPIRGLGRGTAIALVLALLLAVAGGLLLARALQLRDSVLPGVSVAGVEVGGLPRSDARARLAADLGARLDRPVTVTVGSRTVRIVPADLYELDSAATVAAAYAASRDSFWTRLGASVAPSFFEREVEPVIRARPDAAATLGAALERSTRAPVAARVLMEDGLPVVRSGRPGLRVDQAALLADLRAAALAGTAQIEAHASRVAPELTTAEAKAAAAQAETAISAPVALSFEGETLGALAPHELAALVRFQPQDGAFTVLLERDGLTALLEPLVEPRTTAPVDAGFEVVGERVRVVPSQGGTKLAATKANRAVLAAALVADPEARLAPLTLTKAEAALTTKDARALGIREQISTFTTDMGVSSSNRIHNVHLLGQYLDGTIVRPGGKFSFNEVMGPRTPERGFLVGQAIVGGVLVPSIGGGVCQTATTIFNAAFEEGLPVLERHNHSFYISHYPTGRDATVYWGVIDFVFRNDLDHAILIKASWTNETFTVTFYGTDQGRKVVATTSEPTNWAQPSLQYAVDPNAPPGSVRTTAAGGSGFDVNVHRKIYEDGELIRQDDFFTRYTPQHPVRVYGPGTTPPGPYTVIPSSA